MLMDLAKPSSGTVALHPDPEAERALALVFQDARMLPWRRVISIFFICTPDSISGEGVNESED